MRLTDLGPLVYPHPKQMCPSSHYLSEHSGVLHLHVHCIWKGTSCPRDRHCSPLRPREPALAGQTWARSSLPFLRIHSYLGMAAQLTVCSPDV